MFCAAGSGRGNLLQITGSITFQPTNEFRTSFNLNKQRLVRNDTGLVAFDVNILTWRGTYQFTKVYFARAIIDYNTLNSRVRAQFLTVGRRVRALRSTLVTTTI